MDDRMLGAVVRIDGALYECIGLSEGPVAYFRAVGEPCPTCGERADRSYVIDSPLFRCEVKPVETIARNVPG